MTIEERIGKLMKDGRIPIRKGVWIDAYNVGTKTDGTTGTITVSVDNSIYFVTDMVEYEKTGSH